MFRSHSFVLFYYQFLFRNHATIISRTHGKRKLKTCEVIHRFACQNHAVSLWNSSFADSGFANDPLTIAVHVGIGAFDSLLNGTAMLKETSAVRIASIPESQRLVAEFQGRIPHFLSSSSNKKKGGHCWAPKLSADQTLKPFCGNGKPAPARRPRRTDSMWPVRGQR